MIKSIYCIRDAKVGFLTPIVDENDASALRNFSYGVNKADNVMGFAPGDFQLYKIGSFDDETGKIVSSELLELIADGLSVQEN